MSIKNWMVKNASSLKGKLIAVTGSTGGLGRELCGYLACLGASLILLDRNEKTSLEHRDALIKKYGVDVRCIPLDLEDVSRADEVADELIEHKIDVFIHNAGAYSIPRHKCSTGYDNVYQINFATPYYIIRRILPSLSAKQGRVVVVGSIAHNYSRIDEYDVDFSGRSASSKVYGNAKRYLMYATSELFREEKGASLAVVHPGITFTNITAHYPPLIFAIIKHPMKVIFMKPKKAVLSILAGVFRSTGYNSWIGPSILDVWGLPKEKKLRSASDKERRKIAEIAEKAYQTCCESIVK